MSEHEVVFVLLTCVEGVVSVNFFLNTKFCLGGAWEFEPPSVQLS